MSLLDYLRQEYLRGKVIGKYRLSNGNIGLIIDQVGTHRRYHVEFKDTYRGASIENLFGLLKYPFEGKTELVERLISDGDSIELTLSYSKGPLREAYYIHSVSGSQAYKNPEKLVRLPYKSAKTARY